MMDTSVNHTNQTAQQPQLRRLSETPYKVTDSDIDIRDRKVKDAAGEDIGRVSDLILRDTDGKVCFIEVTSGGVLGIGAKTFLVPSEAIESFDHYKVVLGHSQQHIVNGPAYDPELTKEPDWAAYYGYYGYTPYWSVGTPAPPFAVIPKRYV